MNSETHYILYKLPIHQKNTDGATVVIKMVDGDGNLSHSFRTIPTNYVLFTLNNLELGR